MFSRQQRTSARNEGDGSKSAEGHDTVQRVWLCRCQRDEDGSVAGGSKPQAGTPVGQTEQGPSASQPSTQQASELDGRCGNMHLSPATWLSCFPDGLAVAAGPPPASRSRPQAAARHRCLPHRYRRHEHPPHCSCCHLDGLWVSGRCPWVCQAALHKPMLAHVRRHALRMRGRKGNVGWGMGDAPGARRGAATIATTISSTTQARALGSQPTSQPLSQQGT